MNRTCAQGACLQSAVMVLVARMIAEVKVEVMACEGVQETNLKIELTVKLCFHSEDSHHHGVEQTSLALVYRGCCGATMGDASQAWEA